MSETGGGEQSVGGLQPEAPTEPIVNSASPPVKTRNFLLRAWDTFLGKPQQPDVPGTQSAMEAIDEMENETPQQRATRHERDMNSPGSSGRIGLSK